MEIEKEKEKKQK